MLLFLEKVKCDNESLNEILKAGLNMRIVVLMIILCRRTTESGGNCDRRWFEVGWSKTSMDETACIHRLLNLEGAIQGIKKCITR